MEKIKVLIVDDDANYANELTEYLKTTDDLAEASISRRAAWASSRPGS